MREKVWQRWIFLTIPLPNPNNMVKSASQKMIFGFTSMKKRYTGIQKLAPEIPAEVERMAITIPTGKRYQYVMSMDVNYFFNINNH